MHMVSPRKQLPYMAKQMRAWTFVVYAVFKLAYVKVSLTLT